jgi:hypothetical protein
MALLLFLSEVREAADSDAFPADVRRASKTAVVIGPSSLLIVLGDGLSLIMVSVCLF